MIMRDCGFLVGELGWLWGLKAEALSDRYHKSRTDFKTLQDLQNLIFSSEPLRSSLQQIVLLTNQQISPALNSHAGQSSLTLGGQFLITQQGFRPFGFPSNLDRRKYIWRSTFAGMFLQPCS